MSHGTPPLADGDDSRAAAPPIARQVASVLAFRIAALGFTFVAGVITARALGPELRGELAVMMAVPSLLAVLALVGGDTANLYFAGRSPGAHDAVVRFAVVHAAVAAALVCVPLAVAATMWPPVRLGLSVGAFLQSISVTPVLLLVLLLGAAESGRHHATLVAIATATGAALWVTGAGAVALSGTPTVPLLFGMFAGAQSVLAVALVVLSWPTSWRRSDLTPGTYLRYALGTNIAAIALLLALRLDIPLIQAFAGPGEVGLYSVALPMAESLLLLPTAIGVVVLPAVATRGTDYRRMVELSRVATYGTLLAGLAIGAVAPALIPAVFGARFAGSVPVLWALLPGAVMFTAGRTLYTYLVAVRALQAAAIGATTVLMIGLALMLVLIPPYGAYGAAVASSMAYTAFAFVNARAAARIGGGPWYAPFRVPRMSRFVVAWAKLRRPSE